MRLAGNGCQSTCAIDQLGCWITVPLRPQREHLALRRFLRARCDETFLVRVWRWCFSPSRQGDDAREGANLVVAKETDWSSVSASPAAALPPRRRWLRGARCSRLARQEEPGLPNIRNVSPSVLQDMELCPVCHGTGVDPSKDAVLPAKCKPCGGVGWVPKKSRFREPRKR
jgi:hypothetical protein